MQKVRHFGDYLIRWQKVRQKVTHIWVKNYKPTKNKSNEDNQLFNLNGVSRVMFHLFCLNGARVRKSKLISVRIFMGFNVCECINCTWVNEKYGGQIK
jgi:hypothetical protein